MKYLLLSETPFIAGHFLNYALSLRPAPQLDCLVPDAVLPQLAQFAARPGVSILLLSPERLDNAFSSDEPYDAIFWIDEKASLLSESVILTVLQSQSAASACKRLLYLAPPALEEESSAQSLPHEPENRMNAVTALHWPFTILKPAIVYGADMSTASLSYRFIRDVENANPYTRFPYTGRFSAIYAGDLVELMLKAVLAPACENRQYACAYPQPATITETLKILYGLFQKTYLPFPVPRLLRGWLRGTMRKEGLTPAIERLLFEDTSLRDASMLFEAAGFKPYYGFEAGLARTVQWYKQHHPAKTANKLPLQ